MLLARAERNWATPIEMESPGYPAAGRAWYVTIILVLTMALSYVDRTILSLLVVPIQLDLGASDTRMGILLGPAFVLLYSIMVLPVGRLADRMNRRNLLIAGVAVWTSGTIASGLSQSFETLLVARSVVGAGEACVVPCTFSMVADYFPPARRGRAVGAVSTGVSIGAGTALFGGGLMLRWATQIEHLSWPLIGQISAWKLVFIGCGLPGLLMMLMLLTVKEPRRHGRSSSHSDPRQSAFFRLLGRDSKVISGILVAYVLFSLIQYGITAWMPTMLTRRLHLSTADAGFAYGGVIVIISPLAALAGGFMGDALSKKYSDGRLRMAAFVAPFFLPGALLATLAHDRQLVIFGICLLSASGAIVGTSVYATVQELVPANYRGQMLALYTLGAGLVGMMLGAPLIAVVTDYVFGNHGALNLSMLAVSASGAMVAIALFWAGLAGFRRVRANAQA